MKKFTYETPEFYIALTESDIKANDPNNSNADFGDSGILGPEVEETEE